MTGRRYSAQYLDGITSVSDQWLRRCNDQPRAGIPINRHGLRIVLATSRDVAVRSDGTITWRGAAGEFSAAPVRDGDAGKDQACSTSTSTSTGSRSPATPSWSGTG